MTLHTHIDIDAPPARVWNVLTRFDRYPEWNPFVREISGEGRVGERLRVRLGPPGKKPMTFTPVVLEWEPSRAFVWRGTLGAGWIFSGEHAFRLSEWSDGGTRFDHGEAFGGALVPLMRRSLEGETREGFEEMNRALKARVEQG